MRKSIDELFQLFLYEAEFSNKVREATLRGYRTTFALFRKLQPSLSLDDLTTQSLTEFFKLLQERKRIVGRGIIKCGIKKSSVATYWGKLNVFFSWLSLHGYIQVNPFKGMKYPRPAYENRKYLHKEELEKILTAIHINQAKNILLFKRNLVLFYLLLFCGLRKEELLLLQVRDIDFERKIITIRGDTSKSGKTRTIPMHSVLTMHLKDYFKDRNHSTTPYVLISNKKDHRLTDNGLKHVIANLQRLSGVHFHLHQFRHTFAINFLKSTNNIFKLKLLLGHEDIRVTMLYLRHLPTNELRRDVETLQLDNFM